MFKEDTYGTLLTGHSKTSSIHRKAYCFSAIWRCRSRLHPPTFAGSFMKLPRNRAWGNEAVVKSASCYDRLWVPLVPGSFQRKFQADFSVRRFFPGSLGLPLLLPFSPFDRTIFSAKRSVSSRVNGLVVAIGAIESGGHRFFPLHNNLSCSVAPSLFFQLFFWVAAPLKWSKPKKGFLVFPRVTEQLSNAFAPGKPRSSLFGGVDAGSLETTVAKKDGHTFWFDEFVALRAESE